jgi:hypothetical protein
LQALCSRDRRAQTRSVQTIRAEREACPPLPTAGVVEPVLIQAPETTGHRRRQQHGAGDPQARTSTVATPHGRGRPCHRGYAKKPVRRVFA